MEEDVNLSSNEVNIQLKKKMKPRLTKAKIYHSKAMSSFDFNKKRVHLLFGFFILNQI